MEQDQDYYENNTRVVFDYNLKLLVQKLHKEHSLIIEKLKSYDYIILQESQLFIREYFRINQKELNIKGRLTKGLESCPDYFALLCAVVSDLTKCQNWNKAMFISVGIDFALLKKLSTHFCTTTWLVWCA
jgi:hypothetical protein